MVQASIIYITLALALLPSFGTALLGFVLRPPHILFVCEHLISFTSSSL